MDVINMSLVSAFILFCLVVVVLLALPRRKISTHFRALQVLFIEPLEDRVMPATITLHWKLNPSYSTGNILDSRNWDEDLVPGPSTILEFDNSTGIATLRSYDSVVVAGIVMNHFPKYLDILGKMQVGSQAVSGASELDGGDIDINPGGSLTLANGTFNWNAGSVTNGSQGKGNFIVGKDATVVVTGKNGILNANTTVTGEAGHPGVFKLMNPERSVRLESVLAVKTNGQLVVDNTENLRGGITGGSIVLDGARSGMAKNLLRHRKTLSLYLPSMPSAEPSPIPN